MRTDETMSGLSRMNDTLLVSLVSRLCAAICNVEGGVQTWNCDFL
jgi:hypothetical protein